MVFKQTFIFWRMNFREGLLVCFTEVLGSCRHNKNWGQTRLFQNDCGSLASLSNVSPKRYFPGESCRPTTHILFNTFIKDQFCNSVRWIGLAGGAGNNSLGYNK